MDDFESKNDLFEQNLSLLKEKFEEKKELRELSSRNKINLSKVEEEKNTKYNYQIKSTLIKNSLEFLKADKSTISISNSDCFSSEISKGKSQDDNDNRFKIKYNEIDYKNLNKEENHIKRKIRETLNIIKIQPKFVNFKENINDSLILDSNSENDKIYPLNETKFIRNNFENNPLINFRKRNKLKSRISDNFEKKEENTNNRDISFIFETVKNWEYYFPHNNIEKIIQENKIKKMNKEFFTKFKKRKKIKTRFVLKNFFQKIKKCLNDNRELKKREIPIEDENRRRSSLDFTSLNEKKKAKIVKRAKTRFN